MVTNCAVAECKSSTSRVVRPVGLMLHRFPMKRPDVLKIWTSRCKRADKFNPSTSAICSNHFVSTDYKRDFKNELLGLPLRRFLKHDAIPTVFPDRPDALLDSNGTDRNLRVKNRESKKMLECLMQRSAHETSVTQISSDVSEIVALEDPVVSEPKVKEVSTQTDEDKVRLELNRAFTDALAKETLNLKSQVAAVTARNRFLTCQIQSKSHLIKKSDLQIAKIHNSVSSILSPQQMNKLNRRRVTWSTQDIGTPTGRVPFVMKPDLNWIELLSNGGLILPSEQMVKWTRVCEHHFQGQFERLQKEGKITDRLNRL